MLMHALTAFAASMPLASAAVIRQATTCRNLPSDPDWPSVEDWNTLNTTVGGALIQGVPLAQVCHNEPVDEEACSDLTAVWGLVDPL
jgi:hypothetical protein